MSLVVDTTPVSVADEHDEALRRRRIIALVAPPSAFLGLLYGWMAFRTGGIRYTIPAHIAVHVMGMSFAMLLLGP